MNCTLTIFFIFYCNLTVFAQDITKYFIIDELSDKSISLAIGQDYYTEDDSVNFRQSKRFANIILVFNKTKDTVELYNCENKNGILDSFNLKTIYFNKKQAIVLTLRFSENSHNGEAGAYLIKKTVSEIWDIEFQKRIFSALSDYYYFGDFSWYNQIGSTGSLDDWTSEHSETEYSYHYSFKISDKSELIISGLTTSFKVDESSYLTKSISVNSKYPHYCECTSPDNEMGIYQYDNGKFIKKNDR